MEAAQEEQYFRKKQAEQLEAMKSHLNDEISRHQELIKSHQKAIEESKKAIEKLNKE